MPQPQLVLAPEPSAHRLAISRLESASRSRVSSSSFPDHVELFCLPRRSSMRVFLVNPSHVSFGIAVITPRWLYVLAAATPLRWGTPIVCDETLDPFDATQVAPGDVVGIGIHTGNALRGYEVGRLARDRGASVTANGIRRSRWDFDLDGDLLVARLGVAVGDGGGARDDRPVDLLRSPSASGATSPCCAGAGGTRNARGRR